MRTLADLIRAREGWAVDELLAAYIAWREECQKVRTAYARLAVRDREERGVAYAAYFAALDREERAGHAYARHIGRVSRIAT
jgi:hypothetical protein